MISQEQYDFLSREITRWEEADLLNGGQGRAILASYQVQSRGIRCLAVVSGIAATISAVGVFTFIASNSQFIDPLMKGVVLIVMMIASYLLAWKMKERTDSYKIFGEVFALFGCLLFGAASTLIAQKFHLSGSQNIETLIWGLGIIPIALIFQSRVCAVLCSLVLASLLVTGNPSHFTYVAAAVGPIFVAYATRCPLALALHLVAILFSTNIYPHFHPLSPVLAGLGLFVLYILHREHHRLSAMASPFLYVGIFATLTGLFAGQFAYSDTYTLPKVPIEYVQCHSAFALLCLAACFTSKKARNSKVVVIVGGAILSLLFMNYLLSSALMSIISGVFFALAAVGFFLFTSTRTDNRILQAIPLIALFGEILFVLTTAKLESMTLAPICFAAGAVILTVCAILIDQHERQRPRVRRTAEVVLDQM